MARFGVPATTRASLAFYNTKSDLDALADGIRTRPGVIQAMNDIADLYQELIIDHSSQAEKLQVVGYAACSAEGYNPLCGDRLTVYLRMDGDVIADAGFQGEGCAISKASASLDDGKHQGKDAGRSGEIVFGIP